MISEGWHIAYPFKPLKLYNIWICMCEFIHFTTKEIKIWHWIWTIVHNIRTITSQLSYLAAVVFFNTYTMCNMILMGEKILWQNKLYEIELVPYCTFDLNLLPGLWKLRITRSSHWDYCLAGQKKRNFHLGHCLVIIIGWDMIDRSLLKKKHLYLTEFHF